MTVQTVRALPVYLCILLAGCGGDKAPQAEKLPGAGGQAPIIDRVEPSSTAVQTGFNVQPDGQAAIAVFGKSIQSGSLVFWNDQALTTVGGGEWVAATVPAKLYEKPGTAAVTLHGPNGGATSNALEFTVYGKSGPAPRVMELFPGSTPKGKGFNVQPSGESALGVAGADFLPGVRLFFDGKEMKTVFGKASGLSAIIPAASLARAGAHQVWAVNPDGKESNKVAFQVGKE